MSLETKLSSLAESHPSEHARDTLREVLRELKEISWTKADLSELRKVEMARRDAVNALLDAIAMPNGRSFERAWDQACLLFGRFGYKATLFERVVENTHATSSG